MIEVAVGIGAKAAAVSAPVAQGIEQSPSKRSVVGSNPTWGVFLRMIGPIAPKDINLMAPLGL